MTEPSRLDLTSRILCLATIVGLTLAFGGGQSLQAVLLLTVIAASAGAAGRASWLSYPWVGAVEGVTAAIVIAVTLPDGALLLPYLMVPALLAGLTGSRRAVLLVVGGEAAGLLSTLVLSGSDAQTMIGIEMSAPWVVASLGIGLVTDWMVTLRGYATPRDEQSYLSARRLLAQLRTVTRRLSSGLDPVSIGDQILLAVESAVASPRAALFVRTDSDDWTPLVYRGVEARVALDADGETFARCVRTLRAVTSRQPSGRADCRQRFALPVRVGENLVGVVLADGPAPLDGVDLDAVESALSDHALRLDAALIFDEVRALATVEERQRLAREIHDGIAQELASLGYLVDELADKAVSETQAGRLLDLRGEITRVINELRLSIFDLRSEVDARAGLGTALSSYVRTVGARSGLTVHLTLDEAPSRLRSDIESELLRIAQEAVTNARKHSQRKNLWVDCRVQPPSACISIQDDGGGLRTARPDSYGLKIMRERAERIGAYLEICEEHTISGALGTKVTVTLF